MPLRIHFYLFILLITISSASASDLAKEKRWEAQIVDSLIVGEAVKLKTDKIEFLGIFAEHNTAKAMGGAIILHGSGVHPAWPEIIQPLRIQLPDYGWVTLSLQMPILPNDAKNKDYAPLFDEVPGRIQAGIDYLKAKGIQNIVLIGHSLGVTMAHHYLANKSDPAITAMIAVAGGPGYPMDPRTDSLSNFKKFNMPFLDIFGNRDQEFIFKSAKDRKTAAKKAANKDYTQLKIQGADHFFNNMDTVLIKRVRGWLARSAAGTEINKNNKQ